MRLPLSRFLSSRRRQRPARRPSAWRQPRLERLEDRTLLTARLTLNGPQTLVANANVNASNFLAGLHTEMTVDINPVNPLNVAGFVHRIQDLNQIEVYFSTDGGASWTKTVITNSGPNNDGLGHGERFDPSIKFNSRGWLFVAYGFIPDGGGSTRLMVGRTHDGGASFNNFTSVDFRVGPDPALDKWHIATGRSDTNPNQDVLYVAYTRNGIRQRIAVAGSNNNGVGFTAPVDIDNIALPNGNLFAQPAVGPQGQLYVVWHNQGGGHVVLNRNKKPLLRLFAAWIHDEVATMHPLNDDAGGARGGGDGGGPAWRRSRGDCRSHQGKFPRFGRSC